MNQKTVSVIIPVFNGKKYIRETIESVLKQNEVITDIIIIDDGSTDETVAEIKGITDDRIKYYYQQNQGVSAARNHGLQKVEGEFVVFFDADDIMPPLFLFSRANLLLKKKELDFVSGLVKKFDAKGIYPNQFTGPDGGKVNEQILLYDPKVVTCPSNFMFRSEFLRKYNLQFNEKLSSTADRFFILQCGKYGNSICEHNISPLHYRITQNSMSNLLNERLVKDNVVFYQELAKTDLIPSNIRNKSLFLGDYILFGSFWKIGSFRISLKYGLRCFFRNPFKFISEIINRK
jgi:glycosyltransferase involved in cell wall biosynthesis